MAVSIKILQPQGILDGAQANNIRRQVDEIVRAGTKLILIDLSRVVSMDSSGLGGLVAVLKLLKIAGGNLYLCSIAEPVKMLFSITKMDRVFQIVRDRYQFIRAICA
jgi:anti-sigma B factor antagonist